MFLEAMLIGGGALTGLGLGATAVYAKESGIAGLNSDYRLFRQLIKGYETKPSGRIIADSHAHFCKTSKGFDIIRLLPTFSEKMDWQSITTMIDKDGLPDRLSYEEFSAHLTIKVKEQKRFTLSMEDEYASVVHDHELEKDIVFIRSQEVKTKNLESPNHEIHICLEGCSYVKNGADVKKIIESGLEQDAFVMLNHPFSKPQKVVKYWFPNREEKEFLAQLATGYPIVLEGHNMINTLWLSASNGAGKEYFQKISADIPLVANTDAHMADGMATRESIGLAGTLFSESERDVGSLTGKEIIQKKRELMRSKSFKTLENLASPSLFYRSMIKKSNW